MDRAHAVACMTALHTTHTLQQRHSAAQYGSCRNMALVLAPVHESLFHVQVHEHLAAELKWLLGAIL